MPKGGLRPRADGSLAHLIPPKWKSGKTKTIRVPVVLSDLLLSIARDLEEGKKIVLSQDIEQLKAERDQLDREVNSLHEKNGDLHLEIATLKDELENRDSQQDILLRAIKTFIADKQRSYGSNNAQRRGQFSTASRGWDYFREFAELAEKCPWQLLGEDS